MKKDPDLPITTGRDELNLIECPFTLLTDWAEGGRKTLKFTDRQNGVIRHWTIAGSDKYGLPCALDEPVFIAILALTKQQGFKNRKVDFNQLEMLKLMNWSIDGKHYHRLGLAFSRLCTVTIETDYLWDQGKFVPGKFIFHIIDESFLYRGKKKNTKSSWFKWGDTIFNSFQDGNLKNLDVETYFSLKTPISRRFYRLCDKRLYKKDRVSFDLKNLCHEKLGISRNFIYPSSLKQKLAPAIEEHKAKNLLSSTGFKKGKGGSWLLTIQKYKETPEPLPDIPTEPAGNQPKPKNDPLLEKLLQLKIPISKAKTLLQTYSVGIIEDWIMAIDLVKPAPKNKAGYLLKALAEKWELPEAVRKMKRAELSQREEQLKAEYSKFLIVQVDEHLKTMNPEQVEAEIEEFKKLFMQHWGLDALSPVWMSKLQCDFRWQKAKNLDLPTFEEWS